MGLSKSNYIHLQNGRFAGTNLADLTAAFAQFASSPAIQGWAVHFHGGLVSSTSAISDAEQLVSEYQLAGAFPFCFVWESGFWESVRNNLQDISQEPFFKQLLLRLTQYLLPKLGLLPGAAEATESFESVASVLESLNNATSIERFAALDQSLQLREGFSSAVVSEQELEIALANDEILKTAFDDLNARVAAIRRGLTSESVNDATGKHGILPSAALRAELFDSREAVSSAAESLSLTWVVRTAIVAARVGRRVISRFVDKRDHGWYTTIVEELLRELYVDSIGSTFFWNQMKKDTADAFGTDATQHGGSAFLNQLKSLIASGTSNGTTWPRVTLIGHSAGAILVSNLLVAAHQILPTDFQFDVVLLAPAVDCELFAKAIDTNRIRNIRVFGMSDSLEAKDALLSPISSALRAVYPRSLLYFVSGLLETAIDLPLVGMQRYYDRNRYPGDAYPALRKVRGYLQHASDREVWSIADDGAGRKCAAIQHGGFHFEPDTLASVKHILKEGFASTPGGIEISREALESSLSGFSAEDLSLVVTELPTSCQGRFPLRQRSSDIQVEYSRSPLDELTSERIASVNDLLNAAQQLPGGYTQLLLSAHRAKPEAQLLQQHLQRSKTPIGQKYGIPLQEAIHASTTNTGIVSADESIENVAIDAAHQILIGLREPGLSLKDVKGLSIVSQIGRVVAARANRAAIEQLNQDARVVSVELSSRNSNSECADSLPFIGAIDSDTKLRVEEEGEECLIGIIDAELDVLHAAFREPDEFDNAGNLTRRGKTRLVAVWDQSDPTGPAPAGLENLGGTLHTSNQIDGYIQTGLPGSLKRVVDGHGTHVTSIAAGTALQQSNFPGGVAPKARIVVVITGVNQVEEGSPNSIGYSLSHNAALEFLEQTALKEELPLVVNVSQGMNSGAHDGSSLVETMFDDFCLNGRKAGRVVVKSAGNDRAKAGHAFVTLNSNSLETLNWESPAATDRPRVLDVMELWFDSLNELTFRLVSPGGEKSPRVNWSNLNQSGSLSNGNTYSLHYERFCRDNGASRLRVEIRSGAANAIEAAPKGPPAIRGPWMLEISSGVLVTRAEIDAWIDRVGMLLPRFVNHVSEDRTLSVPGTAFSVISVGAIGSGMPLQVGAFSAYGTTRDSRNKPEICAPGISIQAAASNSNHGLRPDSGTSMAAPHVTGAIALVLSACQKNPLLTVPNTRQIVAAIKSMQSGLWDRGTGYGCLNTRLLLRALTTSPPPPPGSVGNSAIPAIAGVP